MKSKPTDGWAALLEREMQKSTPEGEGWLTSIELQKKVNRGRSTIHRFLNDGLAKGLIESFKGSAVSPSGQRRLCIWYRPKTK